MFENKKMARDREPFTMKSVRDNTVVNSAWHVPRPLKASVFAYTRSKKVKRDVQVFTFETVFQPFLVYF